MPEDTKTERYPAIVTSTVLPTTYTGPVTILHVKVPGETASAIPSNSQHNGQSSRYSQCQTRRWCYHTSGESSLHCLRNTRWPTDCVIAGIWDRHCVVSSSRCHRDQSRARRVNQICYQARLHPLGWCRSLRHRNRVGRRYQGERCCQRQIICDDQSYHGHRRYSKRH